MKINQLFSRVAMSLAICFPLILAAQGEESAPTSGITSETISLKGTQYLGLHDLLGLQFTSVSIDGDKVGNSSSFGFQSSYGYNIADNWNINGHLAYDRVGLTPDQGSGSQSESQFSAGFGAWYIHSFNYSNLFIGGSIGGGSYANNDDIGGSGADFNSDIFEYRLGVKYPILLDYGNSLAIYANYLNETETYDDGDINFGGINFGFGTYNFNTSDRFDVFHTGSGSGYADDQYKAGDILLMGTNGLDVQIGTNSNTFESAGDTFTSEDALTQVSLDLCGQYYIIDGFAAQVGLDYSLSKQCDSESDFSNSNSLFQINIGGLKHIDAICPSFYGFGEVNFGSRGFNNVDFEGDEQSDSEGTFGFQIGVGDYYFIAPGLALNGEVFYTSASVGDPTLRNSGIAGRIGFALNPGWKF